MVKASGDAFTITVYPNPVRHSVSLSVNGEISGKASVVVTDMAGRVVKAARPMTGDSIYIDMENLASGMYFIKYSDDTRSETIKVNKQ